MVFIASALFLTAVFLDSKQSLCLVKIETNILSKKHRANTTENILLLLTFRDYTYLINKADL